MHGTVEIIPAPFADTRLAIGRYIGGIDRAERRRHGAAAGKDRPLRRGVTGDAVASARQIFTACASERRAQAARRYFITQGIDPNRLIARGHGKSQLLYPNDPTNELNRRVQFENANYGTASVATSQQMPTAPVHQTPSATESNPAPSADGEGL